MPATLNEKLRDLAFTMQGIRTRHANWTAATVDRMYVDAWRALFPQGDGGPKISAIKGIDKKILTFMEAQLDRAFKYAWQETFSMSIRAMPRGLIKARAAKAVKEQIDDLDPTPVQSDTKIPSERTISNEFKDPLINELFDPPSQREINRLVGNEWNKLIINATSQTKILREIARGIADGDDTEDIARVIRPLVRNDKAAAARIARTEIHRVNLRAQEHSLRSSLGNSIESWRYTATLDNRTRIRS